MNAGDPPLLLFDGICNLCNASIQFLLKIDRRNHLRFASLQSPKGQETLRRFALPLNPLPSVVFIDKGHAHFRSTAVLLSLHRIGGPWTIFYVLIAIPRPLRDIVYNLIASNRFSLFGKRTECMVPTPDLKARFLE